MWNDIFVAALSLAIIGISCSLSSFLDHVEGLSLAQKAHDKAISLLKADCRSIRREVEPALDPYPYDHQ